jgi:hypothetical protein
MNNRDRAVFHKWDSTRAKTAHANIQAWEAGMRYARAESSERIKELEAVCIEAVEWIEDDRFDDDYIGEDWYHAMKKLLGVWHDSLKETTEEVGE